MNSPKRIGEATKKKKKPRKSKRSDDFVSVARRLECDEDKGRFEKKLATIARAKVARQTEKSK